MIKKFIESDILLSPNYSSQFKRLRLLGLRFDAKYIAIILSIPLLIGTISTLIGLSQNLSAWLWSVYIFVFSFISLSIIAGNYFYFKTYNNYYDIFMFGITEDDTVAILKNIYDDYPVIKAFLLLSACAFAPAVFVYYSLSQQWFAINTNVWLFSLIFITSIALMVLLARGTLHSLPLGKNHAQVSSLSTINKIVPNGIAAMEWAFKDRKQEIKFQPVSQAEGLNLMQQALNQNDLLDKTEQNDYLAAHKPHVVFALMESFGTNCLVFDDPNKNDLLGKLRPYFDKDFLFKRFISTYNGTAPALAHLYFYSPIQNISQSIAQKTALPHSPFITYKSQGYKTIFITSGNMMWRNLGNYLPLQGVDEIYDQNNIFDIYPEAKETLSYWGVADEFVFKLAEKLLKETDIPLFINILTITNHPPYEVPKHYKANNLQAHVLSNKFGNSDEERLKTLQTYQYSANAAGEFIENIENSHVKDNTIIAITGDHHIRGFKSELPKEYFLVEAVPFFVHIPQALQTNLAIKFDTQRIGSHKDIFPTLYALSLSETEYWNLGGRNLLAEHEHPNYNFAYSGRIWANDSGVIYHGENYTKYQWNTDLLVSNEITISQEEIMQIQAYKKLLSWQINYLVQGYQ
ncbi:LTA synthase family protein [Cricetibacter osteomyelitidis]|nr:LTA synthase family protein [Cricetibacter osteomyelitidis]